MTDTVETPAATPAPEELTPWQSLRYLHLTLGLHIVPVGRNRKVPLVPWRNGPVDFVHVKPTDQDIKDWWYKFGPSVGWGALCGGPLRLVLVDVESAGMLYPGIVAALDDNFPRTCRRLSQHGGGHAWVEISDGPLPTTQALARVQSKTTGQEVLLAEIRAEGALGVVLGNGRGPLPKDFTPVKMTRAEFDAAVAPIRAHDQPPAQPPRPQPSSDGNGSGWSATADRLLDLTRAHPEKMLHLLDDGWELVREGVDSRGGPMVYLRRPDYGTATEQDHSATVVGGLLFNFSSSVPWWPNGWVAAGGGPRAMPPGKVLALLQPGGEDFAAAMTAVEYGQVPGIDLTQTGPGPGPGPGPSPDDADDPEDSSAPGSDPSQSTPKDPPSPDAVAREKRIRDAVDRLLEQHESKERFAEVLAARNPLPPPDHGLLSEILTRPDDGPDRIQDLLSATGTFWLSAQRKTGKTTLMTNLIRSLITGEPFLGRFKVQPVAEGRRVGLLNYEMPAKQMAQWLKDCGIPEDRVWMMNLRGRANPLASERARAELVGLLREYDVEVLVIDPFGKAFTGKSENDAAEVNQWQAMVDEVARLGGCTNIVVAAHTGWENVERSRGSSATEGWPDLVMSMTKDENTGIRCLSGIGRSDDLPKTALDYDPLTRRLTLGGLSAQAQRDMDLAKALVDVVAAHPGINQTGIAKQWRKDGFKYHNGEEGTASRVAEQEGLVNIKRGPRNARLHYLP